MKGLKIKKTNCSRRLICIYSEQFPLKNKTDLVYRLTKVKGFKNKKSTLTVSLCGTPFQLPSSSLCTYPKTNSTKVAFQSEFIQHCCSQSRFFIQMKTSNSTGDKLWFQEGRMENTFGWQIGWLLMTMDCATHLSKSWAQKVWD